MTPELYDLARAVVSGRPLPPERPGRNDAGEHAPQPAARRGERRAEVGPRAHVDAAD